MSILARLKKIILKVRVLRLGGDLGGYEHAYFTLLSY